MAESRRWAYTVAVGTDFTRDLGRTGRDVALEQCIAAAHYHAAQNGIVLRQQPDAIMWRPGRWVEVENENGSRGVQFVPCSLENATHEYLTLHFDVVPSEADMVDVVADL